MRYTFEQLCEIHGEPNNDQSLPSGKHRRSNEAPGMTASRALTRGTLLRGALACAGAAAAGPFALASRVLAQDAAGGSVASTIASSVGRGLASQFGSYAIGQVMTSIGLSGTNPAVADELNAILSLLETIKTELDGIESYLKAKLNEIGYDVVYTRVDGVIASNAKIGDLYAQLVVATDADEIKYLRRAIHALVKDPAYQTGAKKWDQALRGGNTAGLLQLWAQATYAKSGGIHGARAAQSMQTCWDFFDAQQLLTYTYLMDAINDDLRKPNTVARTLIQQWYQNRERQLLLVRGGSTNFDRITEPISNTVVETRLFNSLRHHTVYSKTADWNFCTRLYGPVTARQFEDSGDPALRGWLTASGTDAFLYTQQRASSPPKQGWDANDGPLWGRAPNTALMSALLTDCGVNLGSGSLDLIGPLRQAGFEVPADCQRLAHGTDSSYHGNPGEYYISQAYRQGGGEEDLGRDDPFYVILGHKPWNQTTFYRE